MDEDDFEKGQKSKDEQEYKDELIAIFKEHWNHARHCENERLWFTNIYAVVVAAVLVFIGNAAYGVLADFDSAALLALFGLILSVIGFLVVTALTLGYLHHMTDIDMVFYYWDKMEFFRHPRKPALFGSAHRWFFEITIGLFAVLLLIYLPQAWTSLPPFHDYPGLLILTFITIFIVIEGLYRCEWKKYSNDCVRFRKALKYDFDKEYRKKWEKYFKDPRDLKDPNDPESGKKTITAEEIRQKVIEFATPNILPEVKEECWLCKLSHLILRIFNRIYNGIICILCWLPYRICKRIRGNKCNQNKPS